ncbi:HPF/RaiA family ribosome-associated protein [Candidatus Woesearchaeota archaeon]|nr:HPF/RaiA family ribosome-associated protein [Candidatus Woesearchaeota archaeon]
MANSEIKTEIFGLNETTVSDETKSLVEDIVNKSAKKFSRKINNDAELKVMIKQYKAAQPDKEHKYSITVHLNFPGETISVDKATDWDLKIAIQKAMKDMENRLQSIYH